MPMPCVWLCVPYAFKERVYFLFKEQQYAELVYYSYEVRFLVALVQLV